MKRVVIVGGGIAGLTLAYRLQGRAAVTLVDAGEQLGGVIRTVRQDGFLIEGGPDSFLTIKPGATQLIRELGLADHVITPSSRTVYVFADGRMISFPEGLFLTVPTRVWPFLKSPIVSFLGKLRMGLDLVLPRGPEVEDESIGSFVRRRLGREALERIAEPIMAGIYMGDAEQLSLRSTFPRFIDIERQHRSLIRAMRRTPPGANTSPLASLSGGMGELVDALLGATKGVTFRTRTTVRAVEPGYRVVTDDGVLEADTLVLAVPPTAASALARPFAPDLAAAVDKVRSVGTVTVSLGFRGVTLPDGTGFVIPHRDRRAIVACTWSSQKFAGRAPEGHVLIRAFLRDPQSDPIGTARGEIERILGIKDEPVVARAFRWPGANPIYEVGHGARVREIESLTPPGLYLTGSGFRGIGLPDGIRDATEIAAKVARIGHGSNEGNSLEDAEKT
ncbi:MAG: protoporphyrinogen oxidase [Planctomycetes bacterium]|nr:protoporphyrinogen oxidase [Planctomycetota bacterium]